MCTEVYDLFQYSTDTVKSFCITCLYSILTHFNANSDIMWQGAWAKIQS